jgi:quercetin dioxygenase-like cupin family protein
MKPIQTSMTDSMESRVLRLADLVAYQDGAVVSRQVLKKEAGNVTVFAFAVGQALSEHTAPFDALVQVLDGEATVIISGSPHRLAAGDSILMPANRPHAVEAVTPFKMLLTMLRSPA